MSKIVRIQVHKNLMDVLDDIRKKIAIDMKKEYNLQEITVPRTLSSQVLAAKMQGKKVLQMKVNKVSMNKGILEIL